VFGGGSHRANGEKSFRASLFFQSFSPILTPPLDSLTFRVTGLVSFLRGRSELLMLALLVDDKQPCEIDHDALFTGIRWGNGIAAVGDLRARGVLARPHGKPLRGRCQSRYGAS
jgi:hypothetical protein